jgi:hypothetical protein
MGTHWGLVFILDFNGNEIKRWTAHSATVNEICIEETGECICLSSLSLSSSPSPSIPSFLLPDLS